MSIKSFSNSEVGWVDQGALRNLRRRWHLNLSVFFAAPYRVFLNVFKTHSFIFSYKYKISGEKKTLTTTKGLFVFKPLDTIDKLYFLLVPSTEAHEMRTQDNLEVSIKTNLRRGSSAALEDPISLEAKGGPFLKYSINDFV